MSLRGTAGRTPAHREHRPVWSAIPDRRSALTTIRIRDMSDADPQSRSSESDRSANPIFRGAKTVLRVLFALVFLGAGVILVGASSVFLIQAVRTGTVQDALLGSMLALMGVGFLYGVGQTIHAIWTSDQGQTDEPETASADREGAVHSSEHGGQDSYGGTASTARPPGRLPQPSGIRRFGRRLARTARAIGCGWFFLIPLLTFLIYWEVLTVKDYLAGRSGLVLTLAEGALVLVVVLSIIGSVVRGTWREQGDPTERELRGLDDESSDRSPRRIRASKYPTTYNSVPKLVIFTPLLWTGFGFLIYYWMWPKIQTGGIKVALVFAVLIVIPIGGVLLYFSYELYTGMQHRLRYDRGTFVLDRLHPTLGGTLRGRAETGIDPENRPPDGFSVNVKCLKRWPKRSDDDRRREKILWWTEQQVEGQLRASGDGISVPVDIDLPEDQPPSTLASGGPTIHWYLDVRADKTDPPYAQRFEISVLAPDDRLAGTV